MDAQKRECEIETLEKELLDKDEEKRDTLKVKKLESLYSLRSQQQSLGIIFTAPLFIFLRLLLLLLLILLLNTIANYYYFYYHLNFLFTRHL